MTWVFLLLLVVTGAAWLTGCAKMKDDPNVKELTIFTLQLRPTFDNYFLPIFEEFERTHPGVKIRWMDQPYQSYETKVITAFIAKHPPDIINLTTDNIPRFARAEFIYPLKKITQPGDLDVYLQNLMKQGCSYQGEVYAFPWYVVTGVTLYNKQIFKEADLPLEDPPQYHYDDLPEICPIIRERTNRFGFFPLYTEGGTLRTMLMEAGVPLLDESGQVAFNCPEGVRVLKFWTDLYRDGVIPSEALTAIHRRQIELYKTGKLAIFGTGPQFIRQVKSDAPEVYENSEVGPQFGWKEHPFYRAEIQCLAVSSKTRYPDLARQLALFVTNKENQLEFCRRTTILPSVTEALKDPFFTDTDDTLEGKARKIAAGQLAYAVVQKPPPQAGKVFALLNKLTENVCLGHIEADEGLKWAEEQVNEILSK